MDKDRIADLPASNPSVSALEKKKAAPTNLARLVTHAAHARRLADLLAEQLDCASAVACYEDGLQWCVEIHFTDPPDQGTVREDVGRLAGMDTARALRFETIAARDWVAASLAGLKPVDAGRFVIHGAHDRGRIPANRIAIEIEASLAFGTGHHGTTRGCLLALDRLLKPRAGGRRGPRVNRHARRTNALDIGTGSGVLALAAAKTMRGGVLASDLDPAAVRIAGENVRRNGACGFVEIIQAAGLAASRFTQRGPYPLVFANILLDPLKRLAAGIAQLLAPGGRVVLSGLLPAHANAALAIYRSHGLRLARRLMLDGWVTLVLTRPRHGRAPPPAWNARLNRRS